MKNNFVLIPGQRIADLRLKKGYLQEDFASLVGVSRQTIVTWEAKDRIKMQYSRAEAVAKALGIQVKDLTNDKSNTVHANVDTMRDIIENSEYIGMHRRVYDTLEENMATHRELMRQMAESIKNFSLAAGNSAEKENVRPLKS